MRQTPLPAGLTRQFRNKGKDRLSLSQSRWEGPAQEADAPGRLGPNQHAAFSPALRPQTGGHGQLVGEGGP